MNAFSFQSIKKGPKIAFKLKSICFIISLEAKKERFLPAPDISRLSPASRIGEKLGKKYQKSLQEHFPLQLGPEPKINQV